MQATLLRKKFLEYFQSLDHKILSSSSLVPQGDTTVLLTTAGMQQMMPFFMGREKAPHHRLTTSQKCFRTNDIDEVGDPHHHTFFEMLGNFSVGDYFKKEVIPFAFTFLTKELGIPKEKLWVTVHPTEDVAGDEWVKMGIPKERIFIDETNFWGPPGESGPCGPDSEIYFDFGAEKASVTDSNPLTDEKRFLEIWNLVFMEFFQDNDGSREKLPKQNIDTGMGLERITRVLQGKETAYETDLFTPLIDTILNTLSLDAIATLPTKQQTNVRIIADHIRAATFLAGDGVTPSNLGRGYVMRRIIRRAIRSGYLLQGTDKQPFVGSLIAPILATYNDHYPELQAKEEEIRRIILEEERSFFATLQRGITLLEKLIDQGTNVIAGNDAFMLYDTYGFPIELTREIASEKGCSIDDQGFEKNMEEQKERSRRSSQFSVQSDSSVYQSLTCPETKFIGYENIVGKATIQALVVDQEIKEQVNEGEVVEIVLDSTPFYARRGGQVGDIGRITSDICEITITDTRPAGNFITHIGTVSKGTVKVGDSVLATVDTPSRSKTTQHHTATHLLHQALRELFGDSVKQAGSSVNPQRLRFDFSFSRKFTDEEIKQLETIVNEKISADLPVVVNITTVEEARKAGAMALFDGKYEQDVRMIVVGDWSKELCGGTHVKKTGEIGTFSIAKQESIGGGLRRIKALLG